MRFKVTNNTRPVGHPLSSNQYHDGDKGLDLVILTCTGGGLNTNATARAMNLGRQVRELEVGGKLAFKHKYRNEHGQALVIDVTFERLED